MRRKQGEWVRIVARFQASGLSVRHFAAKEGVSEQSLRNWSRKLGEARDLESSRGAGFVEIGEPCQGLPEGKGTAIGTGEPDWLVIRLESGVSIEVGPQTDLALLEGVLALLGHAS